MTVNTNYCSAAFLSNVLSLSFCLTHSPQLMIVTAGNEEQNILMFRDVERTDGGGGGAFGCMNTKQASKGALADISG